MKTPWDNLKPLMRCSVCNQAYQPARVLVLETEEDGRTALHLHCEDCGASSIVFINSSQWGVASVGLLTDLEADEARQFFGKDPVSADHVIEMHSFLKDFKGGVNEFI